MPGLPRLPRLVNVSALVLQLSLDEDATGFVAAAYADPRRRGIRPPSTGLLYVEGHGAARRKLQGQQEEDETLERFQAMEEKLKQGYDVCVDVDCEIRMDADGFLSEHCREPPEAVAAMCTREFANRTHAASGNKGTLTDLDISRDVKASDDGHSFTCESNSLCHPPCCALLRHWALTTMPLALGSLPISRPGCNSSPRSWRCMTPS